MTTTAEVVHARECATQNISDTERDAGVWKDCDCGAADRAKASAAGAQLEDRAGAYLYAAWNAYRRAGDDTKATAMASALELIGKAPE